MKNLVHKIVNSRSIIGRMSDVVLGWIVPQITAHAGHCSSGCCAVAIDCSWTCDCGPGKVWCATLYHCSYPPYERVGHWCTGCSIG